jgi:hypothetical protein
MAAWTADGLPELFTTSMGTPVKNGLIFLYQPLLTGNPIVGDAEFKDEAGGLPLQ